MKSAEYTIKIMTLSDHSDTSWEALFDCEDDERRNYKLMYGSTCVDQELTFSEAKGLKAYHEAEDDFDAVLDDMERDVRAEDIEYGPTFKI